MSISDDDLFAELCREHAELTKFKRDTLTQMVEVCSRMRDMQIRINGTYGAGAMFEDQYNYETAASYLKQSIVNILCAMRCIEDQSHRNHVVPFKPDLTA